MFGRGLRHTPFILVVASAAILLPLSVSQAAVFERPLFVGSSGGDVTVLQVFLKTLGFFTHPTATGFFGRVTESSVKGFQTSRGLEPVGNVGPLTRAILNTLLMAPGSASTSSASSPSASGFILEVTHTTSRVIELEWNAQPDTQHYVIYRKEDNRDFEAIATTTEVSYKDTDNEIQYGALFRYYVTAHKVSGDTISSAEAVVRKTQRSKGTLNPPPTDITLSSASVAEGASVGATVGTLASVDDGGDSATFSLTSSAGGLFAIDGSTLEVAGALDFETDSSHDITVQVTDGGGRTLSKNFTVTVTDLDPIASTFTATSTSNTDSSTYTFSSQPIGTADADRYVLVAVQGKGTAEFTYDSVTVGGVTATEIGQALNSSTAVGFFIAPVPTGTTADVVVTTSATIGRASIGLYALTGVGGTVAVDTASDLTSSNPMSGSIDVPAEGAVFAAAYNASGANPTTSTWTGLTERYDFQGESNHDHTGASEDFAAAQTGLTVSVLNSGLVSIGALYVISLR